MKLRTRSAARSILAVTLVASMGGRHPTSAAWQGQPTAEPRASGPPSTEAIRFHHVHLNR